MDAWRFRSAPTLRGFPSSRASRRDRGRRARGAGRPDAAGGGSGRKPSRSAPRRPTRHPPLSPPASFPSPRRTRFAPSDLTSLPSNLLRSPWRPNGLAANPPAKLSQLSRLTVTVDEPEAAIAALSSKAAASYDVLAVEPVSERAFAAACNVLKADIIAVDLSSRLPFKLKPTLVKAAVARGLAFEVRAEAGGGGSATPAPLEGPWGLRECEGPLPPCRGASGGGSCQRLLSPRPTPFWPPPSRFALSSPHAFPSRRPTSCSFPSRSLPSPALFPNGAQVACAPLLRDAAARRQTLVNAQALVRETRGRAIVLGNAARVLAEIRRACGRGEGGGGEGGRARRREAERMRSSGRAALDLPFFAPSGLLAALARRIVYAPPRQMAVHAA